jgi:hypothetical protein
MAHGAWPEGEVDHIDHDKSNNRISNLRVTTRTGNGRNASLFRTNTSGASGVEWYKMRQRWRAYISVNNRRVHLGYFDAFDEAVAARKTAEINLGYHPNHGR